MTTPTDKPAFPLPGVPYYRDGLPLNPYDGHGWADNPVPGMTLREWYAGLALQCIMLHMQDNDHTLKEIAHDAFGMADAMLAESQKAIGHQ